MSGSKRFKVSVVSQDSLPTGKALTEPYAPYMSVIQREVPSKMTFYSNIVVRPTPVYVVDTLLTNEQVLQLYDFIDLKINTSPAHALGKFFKTWSHDNLKGQLDYYVFGPSWNLQLQIWFESKADLIKWKLAWWNL